MPYISPHGALSLQRYKYSGMDLSPLSRYVFQPFWSAAVHLLPTWMAPNLVTLTGLSFIVLSCIVSYICSSDLSSLSPKWVYLFHGICLFLYQTFDAIDGKQARRTGASGPLGELFDHGCDALACTLEALTFGTTVLHGKLVLWSWAIATSLFYISTWETFHTHTLHLPYVNGPTEGLLAMYLAEIWTFFVGPQWWTQDFGKCIALPSFLSALLPEIPMNIFVLWPCSFAVLCSALSSFITVGQSMKANGQPGKKRKKSVLLLLPYFALLGLHALWSFISPSEVMWKYPFLSFVGTGFAFSLLVGRLILSHLCDDYESLLKNLFLPLLILPLGIANALSGQILGKPVVEEYWILSLYTLYTGFLYFHFALNVIHEICVVRNIYCLRLGKRQNVAETKVAAD